jgi:hypothetical protein
VSHHRELHPTRRERRRRIPTRRIIDKEDRVVDNKGGWCATTREGVDEEIHNAEGQNTVMV